MAKTADQGLMLRTRDRVVALGGKLGGLGGGVKGGRVSRSTLPCCNIGEPTGHFPALYCHH